MQQNTLPPTQTATEPICEQMPAPIHQAMSEPPCITYAEHTLILVEAGANKAKVLKELCALLGCDLREGKKLLDTCPLTLLEGASQTAIDEWKEPLRAAGATLRVVVE